MEKKLPKNWVQCSLGEILSTKKGKKPTSTIEFESQGYIPYILIDEMEGKPIRAYTNDSKVSIVNKNDVLLVWDGSIGKCGSGIYGAIGSTLVALTPLYKIPTKFVEYFIIHKNTFIKETSTGTGLQHINKDFFKICNIELPPLAEQIRIVAKLDSLFTQLEIIKTSMANIPVLVKKIRQQVLTQAVTGKLTESWRVGKELEEWKECILLDVIIEKPRNGYSPKAVDYETPVKSLSLSATTSGKFNPMHVKYLDIEIPDKNSHLWLKKNDILIQRSNSLDYVGTAAVYDGSDFDFIYPDIMMKIRANDKTVNEYLFYSLSSSIVKNYFKNNASGTAGNMPKINQETVSKTPINLPPFLEQLEIVSRVESLFAKADIIEKQYETLKKKIDTLPQAILHKAFKGELVEQLDTDGDARELLQQIQELKYLQIKKKQTIKNKPSDSNFSNISRNDKIKLLKLEIKKLLKNKANGLSYIDLKSEIRTSSEDKLIDEVIKDLIQNNVIKQIYSTEFKQMLIKFNI